MNTLQNFFTKTLRLRSSPSSEHEHHHHHHHKIHDLVIDLDKEEFKSNDKISGKLVLKTHEANLREIGKICIKFYDEIDILWEEYQANTLYNTVQYKTYKKPFKVNLESYLDPESAVLINEIQNVTHASANDAVASDHKLYQYSYSFEFDLPCFIHSAVSMPNASYAYYIEALVQNDDPATGGEHKHRIFEHFKASNHNTSKVDVCIYNEIMTPNELLLNPMLANPQIIELQTSLMHIRVTLPKKVYFSNETIPIQIDIDELAVAFNAATSTVTTTTAEQTDLASKHHLKLNKIVFKLYQYCQVNSEEPEKKTKVFDYLIKHTTRKITEKITSNQLTLVENFELPDQLFSSTNREKLSSFNESSPATPKKLSTLSYRENSGLFETISLESKTDDPSNDKFFYGIRVDYKLVIEFWKNFINQDSVAIIPVMIDPEA